METDQESRLASFIKTVLICGAIALIAHIFDTATAYFLGVWAICTIIGIASKCIWHNTCPTYQCLFALAASIHLTSEGARKLGELKLIPFEEVGYLCSQPIGAFAFLILVIVAYQAVRLMLTVSKIAILSFLLFWVMPSKSLTTRWTYINSSDIQI